MTRNISLAREIMAGMLSADGRDISSRQSRAIEIAATIEDCDISARTCYVPSQSSDQTYRIRHGICNCPDGRKGNTCKHAMAVEILVKYGELLGERMGKSFGASMDGVTELEAEYSDFLSSCAAYRPPAEGLLSAFHLEAIGDDEYQVYRSRLRQGHAIPDLLKPLSPWVSRITGVCPRYEFSREFIRGHKDYRQADKYGARGVWIYYELPPGLYEVHEIVEGTKRYRRGTGRRIFAKVQNLALSKIGKEELIRCLRNEQN